MVPMLKKNGEKIPWWPIIKIVRPKSDEEFVEQARRSVRQSEVATKLIVVYMSLMLVACIGLLVMIFSVARKFQALWLSSFAIGLGSELCLAASSTCACPLC
jgi:hypothetical protein